MSYVVRCWERSMTCRTRKPLRLVASRRTKVARFSKSRSVFVRPLTCRTNRCNSKLTFVASRTKLSVVRGCPLVTFCLTRYKTLCRSSILYARKCLPTNRSRCSHSLTIVRNQCVRVSSRWKKRVSSRTYTRKYHVISRTANVNRKWNGCRKALSNRWKAVLTR